MQQFAVQKHQLNGIACLHLSITTKLNYAELNVNDFLLP